MALCLLAECAVGFAGACGLICFQVHFLWKLFERVDMNKRLGHGITAVLRSEVYALVARVECVSRGDGTILLPRVFYWIRDSIGSLTYHFYFKTTAIFFHGPVLIVHLANLHIGKYSCPGSAVVHVVGKDVLIGLSEVVGEQDAHFAVLSVDLLAGFPSNGKLAADTPVIPLISAIGQYRLNLERIPIYDVELYEHCVVA